MKKIILSALITVSFAAFSQNTIGNRNNSASCDSTCMVGAGAVSQESNLQQRVLPCDKGFTGTKLQTRVKMQNGTWSDWFDKNVEDTCVCSNTSESRTVVCASDEEGSKTEQRSWTCSGPKTGSWSNWAVASNTCKKKELKCYSITTHTWSANGKTCSGGLPSSFGYPIGSTYVVSSYAGFNGATGSGTYGPFYCMVNGAGTASWNQYVIPLASGSFTPMNNVPGATVPQTCN